MQHETLIRLAFFLVLLGTFMGWEHVRPLRRQQLPKQIRWPINFALTAINSLVISLLPLSAMAMAWHAAQHSTGLLYQLALPAWAQLGLGILWLDFVIYWQHRLFHRLPTLWRLHVLHHTDGNLDASSALRFHPLEIVVSLVIKIGAILLMGVPPVAVIIFEILLNGMALFNHANISMPETVEKCLRQLLVTPDMHRIHHSQLPAEMHSNFGFNLSLWDRLFRSYTPQASCESFPLGIKHIHFRQQKNPVFLLALPLASPQTLSGKNHE